MPTSAISGDMDRGASVAASAPSASVSRQRRDDTQEQQAAAAQVAEPSTSVNISARAQELAAQDQVDDPRRSSNEGNGSADARAAQVQRAYDANA